MTTTATMTASDSIPIETHHEDMIHDAQLDYYGKRLATCSSDRTVKVFDVIDGEPQKSSGGQVLKGHTGPVWQVAWAHPKYGHILASCSYDGKVLIWKEQQHQNSTSGTWTKIKEHNLHSASVNSISWAPHELGAILACASSDGKLSVLTFKNDGSWDADIFNGHAIGCNAVSWAPAVLPGSLISPIPPTNASNPSLPAPSASSQPTSQPASTTNNTTNPNITPSTTALSTATPTSTTTQYTKRFASAGCDNLVRLWAFHPASSTWVEECTLSAHTDWVRDVAWAPNVGLPRAYIATAGQDKMVYVWTKDGTNGAWVKTALDPSSISSSTPAPGQAVAATAGGSVAGAGAAGGKFPDVVWRVSWSLAGNVLAVSCGDGKVTLWKESLKGAWECVNELAS